MKASSRSFSMNTKGVCIAVFAAAVLLLPSILFGQTDPGAVPQGMSQPNGQPPPRGVQTNTPSSMRDSLGAPGQTGQEMLDKQFVRAAAEGGLADVKLGTLATE